MTLSDVLIPGTPARTVFVACRWLAVQCMALFVEERKVRWRSDDAGGTVWQGIRKLQPRVIRRRHETALLREVELLQGDCYRQSRRR